MKTPAEIYQSKIRPYMTDLKIMTFMALVVLILAVSNCNTVEGAGKDMQAGGEGLQNSANENKTY